MIVAVNGLAAGSDPAPGVAVLRSLRDFLSPGNRLIGLVSGPLEPGLYEAGLLDKAFLIPSPVAERKAFLDRMSRIGSDGGLDVFIPNREAELPAIVSMLPEFRSLGIRTLIPGKRSLGRLSLGNPFAGLAMPAATPAVSGKKRRRPAASDALPPASLVKSPVRAPLPPTNRSGAWYSLALLADRESRVVGHAAVRKILSSRTGGTWMALIVDGENFTTLAEGIARRLHWTGPLTVDLFMNGEGEFSPAGIRPQFPDWIHGAALAGVNLPGMLADLACGRPAGPPCRAVPGHLFVQMSVDIVTDVNRFGVFSLTGEMDYDPA